MAKIGIIYYSTYGHVKTLADCLKEGVEAAGGVATLLRVPETLSEDVLKTMHAQPADKNIPESLPAEWKDYDGLLFGMPTRFGQPAAQMKALWDKAGGVWAKGELIGKPGGIFFGTGTQGGGQESTAITFLSQLVHMGMIYVPMGYRHSRFLEMEEIRGGSPWGPGTYAGATGGRKVSDLEKDIAKQYGEDFTKVAQRLAVTK